MQQVLFMSTDHSLQPQQLPAKVSDFELRLGFRLSSRHRQLLLEALLFFVKFFDPLFLFRQCFYCLAQFFVFRNQTLYLRGDRNTLPSCIASSQLTKICETRSIQSISGVEMPENDSFDLLC